MIQIILEIIRLIKLLINQKGQLWMNKQILKKKKINNNNNNNKIIKIVIDKVKKVINILKRILIKIKKIRVLQKSIRNKRQILVLALIII